MRKPKLCPEYSTAQLIEALKERYNRYPSLVARQIFRFIHEFERLTDPDDDDEDGNHGPKQTKQKKG